MITPTQNLFKQAQQLGVCSLFRGDESKKELLQLFLSPQGVEFCQKHNFPDRQTCATFRSPDAEQLGIYIDAGKITLHNIAKVVLMGDTQAQLHYDDPSKRHEVVLMHGAEAHIKASGFAVVFVSPGSCKVTRQRADNALIL